LTMGNALDHVNPVEEDETAKKKQHLYLHPIEFAVKIFRKHCSKTPPFCRSIYGLTDQLLALQLVMAQKSKMVGRISCFILVI